MSSESNHRTGVRSPVSRIQPIELTQDAVRGHPMLVAAPQRPINT
ncbi:MAG: hypothetical protein ABIX09_07870 [Terrimesophilobacter sp.]